MKKGGKINIENFFNRKFWDLESVFIIPAYVHSIMFVVQRATTYSKKLLLYIFYFLYSQQKLSAVSTRTYMYIYADT